MIERKKTPWGILLTFLVFLLAATYYLCGLFLMPGVTLLNYQEKLLYIVTHPFRLYWNKNTLPFMGAALLAWIMFTAWFLNYYRNFHFGKENGTEEWADVKALGKRLKDPDPMRNTYLSENIAIGFDALSNMNMLVLGGSGSYKTTSVLTRNLLMGCCTNVILDIKGDLLRKHGNYLKAQGITVRALNLINPEESDRYNPFAYIEKETDLIRLITNIQIAVKPPDAMKGDPFWDDGVALYLQAMFYHEWLKAKAGKRKPTMNNILRLVNMESKQTDEEGTTALQEEMDRLASIYGNDYPPVRDYRKLKEGATETVRSIIIMVNAMLRLCETASMKRILEDDDIDIPALGLGIDGNPNRKTALFLVMPDNDPSFNFFISMFYTQMFDVLIRIADFKCHGSLPIHVRLWADEFYAGPKPRDTEKLMGTIRSRNMSIIPMLQSISQIKTIFPQDKWEIFNENCAAVIYMGSGPTAYNTHKYISDMLGEMTIDKRDDDTSMGAHGSSSLRNSRAGRVLMTPGEVKRMPRKNCILFIEGQYPVYDYKALPFHTKQWKESEEMAGKDGYKHPVRVVYNEQTMTYRTLTSREPIQFLDKADLAFYKQAEKTDPSIKVFELEEKDFLYLNWRKQPPISEGEIEEIFRQAKKQQDGQKGEDGELPEDVLILRQGKHGGKTPEAWNLNGSIYECIRRYAARLDEEQLNEIILGLEAGLTEKQVKSYFCLSADKMRQFRLAYVFSK